MSELGMACPNCRGTKRTVTNSRPIEGSIRRRLRCLACNHRYTTVEVIADLRGNCGRAPGFMVVGMQQALKMREAIAAINAALGEIL